MLIDMAPLVGLKDQYCCLANYVCVCVCAQIDR